MKWERKIYVRPAPEIGTTRTSWRFALWPTRVDGGKSYVWLERYTRIEELMKLTQYMDGFDFTITQWVVTERQSIPRKDSQSWWKWWNKKVL